jgi:hypothetical protein
VNARFETDGGFTGRGTGWVAIEGDRVTASDGFRTSEGTLSADEARELQSLLERVQWDAQPGRVYPDQITYTLTSGERTVSWRGESETNEVLAWMWKLRARIGGAL